MAGDDLVIANAVSDSFTLTLPAAASNSGKVYKLKRIDNSLLIVTDTFIDGDVTVGSDTINVATHPLVDLQKVQLTSSGTLPAGLSLATDYYIIFVDSDNVKFASSRANAVSDTAVDITAAAGGGTHIITSQSTLITIDANGSETIDGSLTKNLVTQYEQWEIVSDGANWQIISHKTDTGLIDGGALVMDATVTAPTYGTVVDNKLTWFRNGREFFGHYKFEQSSAGTAGSGLYFLPLPPGIVADTTFLTVDTTTSAIESSSSIGHGVATNSSTGGLAGVTLRDANNFTFGRIEAIGKFSNTTFSMADPGVELHFYIKAVIVDWEA